MMTNTHAQEDDILRHIRDKLFKAKIAYSFTWNKHLIHRYR